MKPITGTDEWSRKQKNCTKIMKMAGAHPRPQSSVDERVFIVLKYTETGKCSGNSQKVSKAVSESEDTVQTNNDGQLQ